MRNFELVHVTKEFDFTCLQHAETRTSRNYERRNQLEVLKGMPCSGMEPGYQ